MTRYRTATAAAVFLCLLCAYVIDTILVDRRKDEAVEERRLILMTADEITGLRLENPSITEPGARQEMVFFHRDGVWFMDSPFPGPASQNAMQVTLSNLSGAVKRHGFLIDAGVDLEDYGLTNPEIVVDVQGEAGGEAQRQEIQIGRASTMGRIYATVAGSNEVFTVTDHLRNQLRRSANEMRSWRLVLPEVDHLTSLTIANAHGRFTLEKREDDQWHVAAPIAFVADQDFTNRFLATLGRESIAGYIDTLSTDVLQGIQDQPHMTLEVEAHIPARGAGADGPMSVWRNRLLVGDAIPEEMARLAWIPETNQKILVRNTTLEDALDRVRYEDFQQKSLFTFDMDDVSQLEIRMGRSRTVLLRDADLEWTFADDHDSRVDQHKANRLLYELAFVESLQFVAANPSLEALEEYQLAPPNRAFTLTTGRGEEERRHYGLALGGPQDVGILYALDQQTSHVVLVRLDGGPNQFMATKGSLMDRRLFPDANSWPARGLIFEHQGDTYAFFFDPELGWATRLHSGEIVSLRIVNAVSDLLLTLSELRIVRKVNPDDPDWPSIQERPMATRLRLFGPASDGQAPDALEGGAPPLADLAMEDLNRVEGGAVAARIGAGTYLIELRDGDTVLAALENLVRSAAGSP